jgi:predicted transcriptional regulator YheO
MTKEDKIKAIHFLDDKGAFLIKKSGDKISKFYDISKYTLYNYLDAETE